MLTRTKRLFSSRLVRTLFGIGLVIVIGVSVWSISERLSRDALYRPRIPDSTWKSGTPAPPVVAQSSYSRIDEGLWQGGFVLEPPPGTTAVLNLCETEDRYRCEVHDWRPIADASPAPDIEWLRGCVEFVAAQRSAGRTVYVHCAAGVSRSGMVTTAYFMARDGKTRDEALEFVRAGRPVTRPNPAFMDLLLEWEALRREERGDPQ